MDEKNKKNSVINKARDWGGIFAGLAALIGVFLTYMQANQQQNIRNIKNAEISAIQEAKLEKAYEVITNNMENLENKIFEQQKTIGELKGAIGELKGIMKLIKHTDRTRKILQESYLLNKIKFKDKNIIESSRIIKLPKVLQVESSTLQRKIKKFGQQFEVDSNTD